MNFIKDSLKLSNKCLGVPLFQLINMCVDLQDERIIKNGNKGRVDHLRYDYICHIIADIKLGPKQKHKNIAYEAEYEIRYGYDSDWD